MFSGVLKSIKGSSCHSDGVIKGKFDVHLQADSQTKVLLSEEFSATLGEWYEDGCTAPYHGTLLEGLRQ